MKCLAWRLAHVGRSKNVSYCYFYWQTLFLLFPAIRFSPPFLSVAVLMHTPLRQPLAGPCVLSSPALSSGGGVPGGSVVKKPPSMQKTQETWVQPLGWEDALEKEWQPTPVFLPGKSHGQGSLGGYKSLGSQRLSTHVHSSGGAHSGQGLTLWPFQVQGWKLKGGRSTLAHPT